MATPPLFMNSTFELGNTKDDLAVRTRPSRNVDYFSHVWKEDEILSSLIHLRSVRGVYSDSVRLENACWRSWAKLKYSLKTTPPESINWWKEYDMTWLYGPLLTISCEPVQLYSFELGRRGSKDCSILYPAETRVPSGVLFEAGRVPDQDDEPADSDRATFFIRSTTISQESQSELPSILKSTFASAMGEEHRSVSFSKHVDQFISLDEPLDEGIGESDSWSSQDSDDSDSDDGLMMKGNNSKATFECTPRRRALRRASVDCGCKTIAILPPTTLKVEEDCSELDAGGENAGGLSASVAVSLLCPNQSSNASDELKLYRELPGFASGRFCWVFVNLATVATAVVRKIWEVSLRR